jgi:hypothetical protein
VKNLESFLPLAVMALFAALRYWVLPHVDIDAVRTLFGPLEIAAYAISVHTYARNPRWHMYVYAALPVATLLWKDIFNFITVAVSLAKV